MESLPCTREYPGSDESLSNIGPGTSCRQTMSAFSRAIKSIALPISALSLHTFQLSTEMRTDGTPFRKIFPHYNKQKRQITTKHQKTTETFGLRGFSYTLQKSEHDNPNNDSRNSEKPQN